MPMTMSRIADMVDSSASLKPKVRKKISTPSTTNRSVSPPGRAARNTLDRNLPFTRLWLGSRARKKEGTPMVTALSRESWRGVTG